MQRTCSLSPGGAGAIPYAASREDLRLDSINESEVKQVVATHAHLSDHLHEQALSARLLASMEQVGLMLIVNDIRVIVIGMVAVPSSY